MFNLFSCNTYSIFLIDIYSILPPDTRCGPVRWNSIILLRNDQPNFFWDYQHRMLPALICVWLNSIYLSLVGLVERNPGPVVDYSALKGLRVIHQNIRSFHSRLDSIRELLHKFKSKTVLCLTETALTKDHPTAFLNCPGFSISRTDNADGKSLGMSFFTQKILN
jgi:hypothetical protein